MLTTIEITNFRNLSKVKLDLNETFNIFYGANGSGKTSLLEAIHYLGMGISFRSALIQRIISHDCDNFILFGSIQNENNVATTMGIERTRVGLKQMRVAGKAVESRIELAQALPLQLIDTQGYRLLEAGPGHRRRFMDLGMFHVEQAFLFKWRQVQRLLRQRNAALRQSARLAATQIKIWDIELAEASNELHQLRYQYTQAFIPIITELLLQLLEQKIAIEYYPGWDLKKGLQQQLQEKLTRDIKLGYTGVGPQKADLRLKINNIPAQDVLSRGQQKLLVCALQLAQGLLLKQKSSKNCIYLIDDLPSELDRTKQQRVLEILKQMQAQVFITGINETELRQLFSKNDDVVVFEVRNGLIGKVG